MSAVEMKTEKNQFNFLLLFLFNLIFFGPACLIDPPW